MGTDVEPFYGTILEQSWYAKLDETPIHVRFLEPYRIARYPVTNAEYEAFVNATGHTPPLHWTGGKPPEDEAALPVVRISWTMQMRTRNGREGDFLPKQNGRRQQGVPMVVFTRGEMILNLPQIRERTCSQINQHAWGIVPPRQSLRRA